MTLGGVKAEKSEKKKLSFRLKQWAGSERQNKSAAMTFYHSAFMGWRMVRLVRLVKVFFFNVGPLKENIFFDHLLWSIFQSMGTSFFWSSDNCIGTVQEKVAGG